MQASTIYNTYKRYRTLQTHKATALPVVILMPHSACNCRCVMCDIWKDNKNQKQLTEADVVKYVHEVIVSLDGDEMLHDAIRNIPNAFSKLKEGVAAIKALKPDF